MQGTRQIERDTERERENTACKMYVANTTGGLMLQTMLYLANHTSRAAVNTLIDLPPAPKSGKYHGGIVVNGGGGGERIV